MRRSVGLLVLLFILLPGCEIADVQPFTTATRDMGTAIDASLQQVLASFRQADKVFVPLPDQKREWEGYKQELQTGTDAFKKAAHAFDKYASALEEVTADGQAHEKKIEKVFDATKELADAAGEYAGPYKVLLGTAITSLGQAVQTWNTVRTNNKLKALASPEQDSVIQKSARLLRLGLKQYAKADSGAYNLLLDNDPVHRAATQYATATQKRRAYAQPRLLLLIQAENSLLTQPLAADLLDGDDGYVRSLENLKADEDGSIRQDFNAFKKTASTTTSNALFAALRSREQVYLRMLADNEAAQAVADEEEKRWTTLYTIPQQKSQEQFQKSQQAIGAWASSHHELRLLLRKSGKVTRQDLVAQAQNVQKIVAELKDAKEAAAKAAKAAAKATPAK